MDSGHAPSGGGNRPNLIAALSIVGAVACIVVPASWRIAAKAGYPPALSLLSIVSPVNLALLIAFAVREWPIERALRDTQERLAAAGRSPLI